VGFGYADPAAVSAQYDPTQLSGGFNTVQGERIFFVPDPAAGLWATSDRFDTCDP
jgi:hypothetical protein